MQMYSLSSFKIVYCEQTTMQNGPKCYKNTYNMYQACLNVDTKIFIMCYTYT